MAASMQFTWKTVVDSRARSISARIVRRPRAYASDPDALRLTEEGLRNGHCDALGYFWEKMFFVLPMAHTEGPDHLNRMGPPPDPR